ncbi:MAG: acetyl/propionyl/methylcrotonyl-CoA carboxylase subunit alpha [Alphaproteobacteria bacterium]|nr:acetyl/propionyl/methylcrotonyl-CoA carboxylase subunit alpha [Alphaproteobacteria bacterium]
MISSLLIANRGEIAVRIMRTARRLGIRTVAVYSEADVGALHVATADEAVCIGPSAPAESYLDIDAVLSAARNSRAAAIHPGYGFLSENAGFAEACQDSGIIFVGPTADAIRAMGDKAAAKTAMERAGVPLVPGYHGNDQSPKKLAGAAKKIGFPVLIKASAGGGGRGMRIVRTAAEFTEALDSARREAQGAFGDDRVILEKYLERPRHIEVQVFGDTHGNLVHLFERDCSLQRRYQKVIEEAPAPGMSEARRAAIGAVAIAAAKSIDYVGAGTVEFIVDAGEGGADGPFYFMEMNTRLQVEHPVTEMITGYDLVEWQLRVASGEPLPASQGEIVQDGHAVEARLYAEDPARDFLPAAGRLVHLSWPDGEGVRIDTGIRDGDTIAVEYDPLIAKVIAHGPDRKTALRRLHGAMSDMELVGPVTNQAFLAAALDHPDFVAGDIDTNFIGEHLVALVPPVQPADDATITAALAFLLDERGVTRTPSAGDANSPWQATDGWRPNLPAREHVILRDGELEFAIDLVNGGEGWQANLPDRADPVPLGPLPDGVGVYRDGHTLIVVNGARQHRLAHVVPLAEVDRGEGAGGGLTAPMPGKVVQAMVAAGDKVVRGQTVMILEAMKMEHAISAPADGTVADVYFAAGDQVDEGAELLRLAKDDD